MWSMVSKSAVKVGPISLNILLGSLPIETQHVLDVYIN